MAHVHFIGVTDEQYHNAVRVWGPEDFYHRWHDWRSHGDIDWEVDTVVFGDRADENVFRWTWQDHALH